MTGRCILFWVAPLPSECKLLQGMIFTLRLKCWKVWDTCSQKEPDTMFDMRNSSFKDTRIHGMDHKAIDNPREYDFRIFSQVTPTQYKKLL